MIPANSILATKPKAIAQITGPVQRVYSSKGSDGPHGSRNPHFLDATRYRRNTGSSLQNWLIIFPKTFVRFELVSVVNAAVSWATWGQGVGIGVHYREGNTIHISGGSGVVDVQFRAFSYE